MVAFRRSGRQSGWAILLQNFLPISWQKKAGQEVVLSGQIFYTYTRSWLRFVKFILVGSDAGSPIPVGLDEHAATIDVRMLAGGDIQRRRHVVSPTPLVVEVLVLAEEETTIMERSWPSHPVGSVKRPG